MINSTIFIMMDRPICKFEFLVAMMFVALLYSASVVLWFGVKFDELHIIQDLENYEETIHESSFINFFFEVHTYILDFGIVLFLFDSSFEHLMSNQE